MRLIQFKQNGTYIKRTPAISLLIILTLFFIAPVSLAASKSSSLFTRYAYNPQMIYQGPYISDQLYYKNAGSTEWSQAEVRTLRCADAQKYINTDGRWQGSLYADGSCSNGFSVMWAIGNRLNFDNTKK